MAEIVPTIPAGSSADWIIKIKNVDGSYVFPGVGLGYAIFIYDSKGRILKKYSKNEITGFINSLSDIGTEIRMIWEASHTKEFPAGEIFYQYMHQVEDDDFEESKFTAKTVKTRLCIIEDTESKFTTTV